MTDAQRDEHLAKWETYDGTVWHVVDSTEMHETATGTVRTLVATCDSRANAPDVDAEAPVGERPDEQLTGTTICYACLHRRTDEVAR